jgi:phospholipase C
MSEKKNKVTRRDAIKNLGIMAGAAAVPGWLLSACAAPEDSVAQKTGPLEPGEVPIENVITVMMENRSFDTYFGTLSLNEGRSDIDGLAKTMFNLDTNGKKIFPWNTTKDRICVEDPPHGWEAFDVQYNNGKNDGFVLAHLQRHGNDQADAVSAFGPTVMQYYKRQQLPFLHSLADDFTLCQKWHCSVRGPTWPNRWYLHGAQSNGITDNDFNGDYSFEMIYDRLTENGITWAYYYTDLPFLAVAADFLKRHKGRRPLRPISEFYHDLANGTLPQYCMVDPGFNLNDDHPPHHTGLGEQFLSTVYHSVAESKYWNRSMLFVTYDENGGFFDHVPPPKTEDNFAAKGFDRLGFRVPGIVAGPYVKQSVSNTLFDHTSILAFLEWKFGMEPLTKRDAAANNFSDLLDADRIRNRNPRQAPVYAEVHVDDDSITDACKSGGGLAPTDDIHTFANMGLIPRELDLRSKRYDTLKLIAHIEASRVK